MFFKNDKLSAKRIKQIFSAIPTLETPRLLLRKIDLSDTDDMYEYSRLDSVTKYLTWSSHVRRAQTENHIKLLQRKYASGDFYDWAVIEKTSGKMIGTCGFTNIFPKEKTAEVGYVIAQDFWGKGIAKEALCEVLRFGFETFDFERIYARHMLGNDASGKVMQKCGMTFENIYKNSEYIKGEYKTILVYGITKQNFEKMKETK